MHHRRRLVLALTAVVLLIGACGSDGDPADPEPRADSTAVDGVAEVPLVLDLDVEAAVAEVERAGLVAEIVSVDVADDDPRLGTVVDQSPDPFGWLPEGSVMRVTVGE